MSEPEPAEAPTEPGSAARAPTHKAQMERLRQRLHDEVRRRRWVERLLMSATETERRRISLELHDGLGQHLSGLAYAARSLADHLSEEQHAQAQEAEWLARLLRDGVGRVRAMSRGLWPASLERQSLPQALSALARDIEQLHAVAVQVHAEGFDAESAQAAHHLFRIVQEAIHNALEHGRARNITVRLERVAPGAMLSIVSDGKAMAPLAAPDAQRRRGLGLMGMQLRAEALGGELNFSPLEAGGVEVCLVWRPGSRSDRQGGARAPTDDR